MPVPIQDFHLPSSLLAGSMQGGVASPLHSPKQGTPPSPCPSSGVLFRLPSPGRSIIMASLRTSCHRKPRAGCRSLPSFFYYDPSVYPIYRAGRLWRSWLSGATLSRGNLLKPLHTGIQLSSFLHSGGKPLLQTDGFITMFKACNKHTESCAIFLGIKIPICRIYGYVCSYFGFPYM